MASQRSTAGRSRRSAKLAAPLPGYLSWSKDPAVGLFCVLPLWIGYEVLRQLVVPDTMNGAQYLIYQLPPVKDARAWVRTGATRLEVEKCIAVQAVEYGIEYVEAQR